MQEMNRQQIVPINIQDEMSESYLDYSMSVIVGRALPDVRDGLKPVHRRIIYAMHDEGLASNKPHSKCAGVVGEVLKKYHPHGDSAVYDALVRMAQPWNLRYPLIDGQGNFGSIDGDAPAAYRYTEARLSKLAELLLRDIDKSTVDFVPNFDGRVNEPTVLPSAFPNLLVNGSAGIAVGMATNIPPHNLGEAIDALQFLIKNPDAKLADLMKIVQGPDFPTGGYIYGRAGIVDAYQTGRGKVVLRARMMTEQLKAGREAIVVTQIPYQVNKTRLIEEIAAQIRDKKLVGISDLRDESDRDGMRIVIELRRGENPQIVINNLYSLTQLQTSFGIIMLALVGGRPRYLSLKRMLEEYLLHRREIVVRRTRHELEKARKRIHIVQGLRVAVENIDAVIKLIRASSSTEEAREGLIKRFDLTVEQAAAILEMPLRRLTSLEIKKLEEEHAELLEMIEEYTAILADPKRVTTIVSEELAEVRQKFGDDRLTEITDSGEDITIEDLIAEERMVITVSHEGYIKRTPTSVYRSQRRGGKGSTGMKTKEADWAEHVFVGTTHNYILFITNRGKAYWLKVYELPQAGRASRGRPIVNLLQLEQGEMVMAMLPIVEFSDDRFLIMATKNGRVVKNPLSLYSNPRKSGIKAIKIEGGDEVIAAKISDGRQEMLLGSRLGMAVRFNESQLRPMGRFVGGVRGIRLREGDEVVGMAVLRPDSSILTVCENGYGKRTRASEYRLTNRGGMGVINIKTSERNGPVIALLEVFESEQIIMISEHGQSTRSAIGEIREISRATQGVRLMQVAEGDKIAAVARIEEDEVSVEENGSETEGGGDPESPEPEA
jgi:DNA gyrase subunit A